MAIILPNLDDRTYNDLVQQARELIPTFDSSWTNHNPSDPGIALVELFAWLAEMLIYRINRVPRNNLIAFLKLLNGPEWNPGDDPDLAPDIRATVLSLRKISRAATGPDYEALAREAAPAEIARARSVPESHLDFLTEAERRGVWPGHVSVIIVPASQTDAAPQPGRELRDNVFQYLDARRLVTTRLHVVGPIYVPVGTELLIARRADVPPEVLTKRIESALAGFLHPLSGGPSGAGWPFGRDIYVSELYHLLENVPGVDYVPDIRLSSQCPPAVVSCVAAQELWHDSGDLVGLALAAHHLPRLELKRILIGDAFVPVEVSVAPVGKAGVPKALVNRAVKAALGRLFNPLCGGPDGTGPATIARADIQTQALAHNEVAALDLADIRIQAEEARVTRSENGDIDAVAIHSGEMVDLAVKIA